MKKILFLSDTHGYLDEGILGHVVQADEVWHAGDIGHPEVLQGIEGRLVPGAKLRSVKGNIDGGELLHLPEYISFLMEGFSLLMVHIAGPLGRYTPRLRQLLQLYRPQLLLCGHSHMLKVQRDAAFGGMLYVNPGAAGIHGFHKQRTMIRMVLDQGKITQMEIIDMGKRGKIS